MQKAFADGVKHPIPETNDEILNEIRIQMDVISMDYFHFPGNLLLLLFGTNEASVTFGASIFIF